MEKSRSSTKKQKYKPFQTEIMICYRNESSKDTNTESIILDAEQVNNKRFTYLCNKFSIVKGIEKHNIGYIRSCFARLRKYQPENSSPVLK